MRILIIDFAYQNINRTVMLWQLAWRQAGDAVFFGPGHVSDEDWRHGLKPFIRLHGPFDVIVTAELLISALSTHQSSEQLKRALDITYECPFNVSSAMDGCRKVFDEFVEADAIKVVSMLEFDSYNMNESHYNTLSQNDFYVVGWGEDFIKPVVCLPGLNNEKFGSRANDRWWEFVTKYRHRVISTPAMVAETEFYWANLEHRTERWAVQGARYYARQLARRKLNDAKIAWTGKVLVDLITVLNRINPRLLRWPSVRTFLNHHWTQGFRTSRYAFTCGSALRYPIRKYFEIPAAGAVLAAEPPNGFEALGFRDHENAVITTPETIVEIDAWLRASPSDAQRIASAGRELVWQQHRVGARAKQYIQAIEAIAARRFFGSRWQEGRFVVAGDSSILPFAHEV